MAVTLWQRFEYYYYYYYYIPRVVDFEGAVEEVRARYLALPPEAILVMSSEHGLLQL